MGLEYLILTGPGPPARISQVLLGTGQGTTHWRVQRPPSGVAQVVESRPGMDNDSPVDQSWIDRL